MSFVAIARVIVGILLILFVMDKLSRPHRKKRRKKLLASMEILQETLGGDLHDINNFLTLKSSYEGMPYECRYFIGGSHVAESENWWINSLEIRVGNCRCRELVIKKEGGLGFGKKVGLVDKFLTHDKRFDDRFFIETADRRYAEELLKKREVRQAITEAADNDVRDFSFTNDTLIIDMNVDENKERADLEDIRMVLCSLKLIHDNLPPVSVGSQLQAGVKTLEGNRNTAGKLILLFFAAIIAAMVIGFFRQGRLGQEDLELAENITIAVTIIGTLVMGRVAWQLTRNTAEAIGSFIFLMVVAIPAIYLFSTSIIKFLMELL